jgi:hypothetical protein
MTLDLLLYRHRVVANGTLSVSGNANVGNLGTAQVLASANITFHLQLYLTSQLALDLFRIFLTTQVANLNVATAGLATYATTANSVAGAECKWYCGFSNSRCFSTV